MILSKESQETTNTRNEHGYYATHVRDNFKTTGNTVKSFNDTRNKSFNIECSGYKISSFNKEFMKQI